MVEWDMDEAELTEFKAKLVAALSLDRPEHTAYVLALLANSLAGEARCHRAATPEEAATLLALNELQHAISERLVAVLTYRDAGPAGAFIEGLFAAARDLGCGREWRLAVCDVLSVLALWLPDDEDDDE